MDFGWARRLAGFAAPFFVTGAIAAPPEPPRAGIVPHETVVHGVRRVDNYYWLRERDNPQVRAYLEAENAYTEAMMVHTKDLQETLFQEMKARIRETDQSAPYPYGDYLYYTRTVAGRQYPIYCRRRNQGGAAEQVLLDVNELAGGHAYCRLGVFEVSPDHRLLVYSVDTTGAEQFTLHVRDLQTGSDLPDQIPNTSYDAVWANDNRTLLYTTLDEARRPFKVFRHRLGSEPSEDVLVYHEPDERFFVGLKRTRSGRFLFIKLQSAITTEYRYLDADNPDGEFRVFAPRRQGVEYNVAHQEDRFLIVTNRDAVNFRLMEAPLNATDWSHWTEVIPHRDDVKIDSVDAFRDFFVVYGRQDGLRQIFVYDVANGTSHRIASPEPVYVTYPGTNREYDTGTLRFIYTSLVTPRSVYDYDMRQRTRQLRKRQEVLGGYDPDDYVSERIYARAPDGTPIPMSLVYRRGVRRTGDIPTLLYGYGAYGISIEPTFSSNRLSLLDRGMIYAIAHVRGGGEMGRRWYEDGKFLRKKNTFTDFIACAEELIRRKYTRPQKLAILGGSAGGMLMGAVANMRPELFQVVVAKVPFVDVVNTMLDESIPLTVTEYEEWGNPHDKKYFEYMLSYSPYDNVRAQNYPNMLITAGLNDPRVQYWEPAKWCAKLRALKTDNNVLLLRTNMGTGHAGASGRYDALRETAFDYAFILDRLGVTRAGGAAAFP